MLLNGEKYYPLQNKPIIIELLKKMKMYLFAKHPHQLRASTAQYKTIFLVEITIATIMFLSLGSSFSRCYGAPSADTNNSLVDSIKSEIKIPDKFTAFNVLSLPPGVTTATTRKELFSILANQGLEIKVINIGASDAKEALNLFYIGYRPQLKGNSLYQTQTSYANALKTELKTTSLGLEVTGQYYGGINYSFNLPKLSRTLSYSNNTTSKNYTWDVSGSLTVNLLKGSALLVGKIPKTKAEIAYSISKKNRENSIITLVNNVENKFYNLFSNYSQVIVNELSLKTAQQLLTEVKEKYMLGENDSMAILKVELQIAQTENALLTANKEYMNAQAELKEMLNITDPNKQVYPDPKEFIEVPPQPDLKLEESIKLAKENRTEYTLAEYDLQLAKMSLQEAYSNKFPSLDLNYNRAYSTTADNFKEAGNKMSKFKEPNSTVGLTFSYVFTEDASSSAYRSAKSSLKLKEISFNRAVSELEKDVSNSIYNVKSAYRKLEISKITRFMSEKKFDSEYQKYKLGEGILKDIIDYQTEVTNARINEITSKIELLKALSAYYKSIGKLPMGLEFTDFPPDIYP